MKRDLKKIISQMTLEEKAGMCSGLDFWHLKSVERLGIPEVMVSDGPHGLRKQDDKGDHLGMNDSIKAVCFPPAALSACSFDRSLMEAMGETIGREAQANDVSVVLGPAVNIKRSPLCGRNFEYYSEDPYLAGEVAAAFINGVQSQHVGTSIKHFAANNQEYHRMSNSSEADERTLREIYFPAFETAVKKAYEIAKKANLPMQLTPEGNADYPHPTGQKRSDHAHFSDLGIPYIYFEATNWLNGLPVETEKHGLIMHSDKDDLSFIENEYGNRAKDTMANYSHLLDLILQENNWE